jgi:hypothetical protein
MSEFHVTKLPSYADEIGLKLPLYQRISGLLNTHQQYDVEFIDPVWLRCFFGPGKLRRFATLVFFQDPWGEYYYKAPNRSRGYNMAGFWEHIEKIRTREGALVYKQTHHIIMLDSMDEDNPRAECPRCGMRGRLYNDFSLLESGFNGIKTGNADDVGKQECGHCKAKLDWDHC